MAINVRRSLPEDHAAILSLMDSARGVGLSDEERARRGFVQGQLTGELLDRFQEGPGIFVADADGDLAGFAITSEPGSLPPQHPAAAAVAAVTRAADGRDPGRLFLYGPVAVDERFQGRGVLTQLLTALSRALQDDFDLAVAFVETANERSLAVHRHYGMTEAARFEIGERAYVAFTFAPSAFAQGRS
ncbi:Acetyltransferase (GNAT) family protein [Actinacidiphila yanglinensis]|uniref:Acetyltransferase (GNAT) family protein n=1 Tax=Actinacidiphila yanglinensis TaxID=310779 RepID=A0A1H6EDX1_9ACTN|nr:GNAT family N-acetyltransferase [Actinacidiphila yanglinensis]SEG95074.1 Acetyltransferase (GNAT) family protein [Actinacidiphila yanglinensis]